MKLIPVMRPLLPSADRLMPYLRRIDASRCYSNHGSLVREFERRLADHLQLPSCGLVSAASGTAALIGAILAVAGRAKPERPLALVPAFTFVGTASAVEQCGYQPHLADIDADTWMLDPLHIARYADLGRIGLVVPVAPFGRGVPQATWAAFQRQTDIPVAIDGAASLEGITQNPKRFVGAIPVALSFHATKSFATGEGGGVASSDLGIAERAMQALNFGFSGNRNSRTASLNGKMSEYHAAVGLAELDGWDAKSAALQAIADCYRVYLDQAGLTDRFVAAPDVSGSYALFRCASAEEAARVENSLTRNGIDFRLWYGHGLHRQAYFADLPRDCLDVTESLAPQLLGLPIAPDLAETAIARIVTALGAGVWGCH